MGPHTPSSQRFPTPRLGREAGGVQSAADLDVVSHEARDTKSGVRRLDASRYVQGTVIHDRYELVERIGSGGMGVVWRAEDRVLRRAVAIKLVRSDRAHPVISERLLREARAAAAIDHPGVVDTLDFGTTEQGDTFLVMSLLNGIDVDTHLENGPYDAVNAVMLVAALVDALDAAHEAGVVHRDIKPGNVVLHELPTGVIQPVLVDFGIARLVEERTDDGRLTVTGELCGTPAYMSPEQAAGETDIDERTDLWASSALLYELLTGLPPFDGNNYNAILKGVLMHSPTRLGLEHGVDDELWSIIERGLNKSKDRRFQTAREMANVLDAWLVRRGVDSDASGRSLSVFAAAGSVHHTERMVLHPAAPLPSTLDERPHLQWTSGIISIPSRAVDSKRSKASAILLPMMTAAAVIAVVLDAEHLGSPRRDVSRAEAILPVTAATVAAAKDRRTPTASDDTGALNEDFTITRTAPAAEAERATEARRVATETAPAPRTRAPARRTPRTRTAGRTDAPEGSQGAPRTSTGLPLPTSPGF